MHVRYLLAMFTYGTMSEVLKGGGADRECLVASSEQYLRGSQELHQSTELRAFTVCS